MIKCLIIDTMHESLFPMLTEIGIESVYKPTLSRDEIRNALTQVDALIVRSKTKVDADLLGSAPRIKFVGRAGAGLDNLDLNFLLSKNIQVVHAAEGNRDAVAEHTIGLLLSLLRHIPKANQEVKYGIWLREENRGSEIMEKTIAIIGYGNMGQAFAKRLSGFGCKVLAYDKYKADYSDAFCREASMEEIFNEADVLSLHIPLTSETKSLVNRAFLNRFKKNIVLLNTSRGEIVSQKNLVEALEEGKVTCVALDVLENEKISELNGEELSILNSLKNNSNVILTPHIAGWTFESHLKINVALVDKIKALKL